MKLQIHHVLYPEQNKFKESKSKSNQNYLKKFSRNFPLTNLDYKPCGLMTEVNFL